MRSAGCVLNDLVDRNIDPYVERTRHAGRSPPAQVAPMEALMLFIALVDSMAIGLATMLNRPAQFLAVIAAGLTIIYPFIKRFVSIPQFFLGAAFGWAVPMAFAAQTGEPSAAGLAGFRRTALIWAVIYDTFYAMVDRDDDLKRRRQVDRYPVRRSPTSLSSAASRSSCSSPARHVHRQHGRNWAAGFSPLGRAFGDTVHGLSPMAGKKPREPTACFQSRVPSQSLHRHGRSSSASCCITPSRRRRRRRWFCPDRVATAGRQRPPPAHSRARHRHRAM